MFASGGYFRTVTCPFFASGLCHRPYCHFKHAPELKAAAAAAAAAQSSTHTGIATLAAASQPPLSSCDALGEHEVLAGRAPGVAAAAAAAAPVHRNASQPSYTPTPRQLLPSATPVHAASSHQPLTYKPTPISELRAATAAATSNAARATPPSSGAAAVVKESSGVTAAAGAAAAAPSAAAPATAVPAVATSAAAAGGSAPLSASGRHRSTATIEYDPEANYRTPEGLVDGGARLRRPSEDAGSRKSKPPPTVLGSRPVEPPAPPPCGRSAASAVQQSGEPRWSLEDNAVRRVSGERRPSAGADASAAGQPAICRATMAKAALSHANTGRPPPAVAEPDGGEAATKSNAVAAVGDRPTSADALEGAGVDRKQSRVAGAARLVGTPPELRAGGVSRVTDDRGIASIADELASGSCRSQKIGVSPKTEALVAEERLTTVGNDQLLVEEQPSSSASNFEGKVTHMSGKFRLKEVRVVLSRLPKEDLHGLPLRPKKHAKHRISSSSSSSPSGSEDSDDSSQDSEPQKKHARRTSKHKFLAAKAEKEQDVTTPSSPSVRQLHNRIDSTENSPVVNRAPVSVQAQVGLKKSKVTGNHFSGSSAPSVTGKRRFVHPLIPSSDDEDPNSALDGASSAKLCSNLVSDKKEGPATTVGGDSQQQSTGASAAAQPTLGDAVAKKRIAHNVISSLTKNSPSTIKAVPALPPTRKPTPAEVLQARYEMQRARTTTEKSGSISSEERVPISETDKPIPSVAGRVGIGADRQVPSCSTRPTVGKTTKSEPRKAHQPSAAVGHLLSRPRIKANGSSSGKVSVNFRQSVLDRLVDEAIKTCASIESAYERAVREEASAYARSGTKDVYRNLMAAAIKKLRDEKASGSSGSHGGVNVASCTLAAAAAAQRSPGSGASSGSVLAGRCASGRPAKTSSKSVAASAAAVVPVSHDQLLLGKAHGHVTLGLKKKEKSAIAEITASTLKGPLFCDRLLRYVLTEDQLVENGFPRPAQGAPSGTALIKWSEKYDKRPQTAGEKKCCVRCGKAFAVLPGCIYAKPDEGCSYHWGRRIKKKVTGQVEAIYTCCQSSGNAEACVSATCHVYDSNKYEDVTGYVEAPKDTSSGAAAYAIDCEMVYTTAGIELARVTLIDDNLQEVLDVIVLPSFPVVDCNTRFSGLTEDSFRGVTTTFTQARSRLFEFVSTRTILIGHSLENDLRTLKIFHSRVVDTSVVFPHRMGPPAKCALRDLVAENLMRIIQDDGDTGHDSSADARACMELMKWKVVQDLKKETR